MIFFFNRKQKMKMKLTTDHFYFTFVSHKEGSKSGPGTASKCCGTATLPPTWRYLVFRCRPEQVLSSERATAGQLLGPGFQVGHPHEADPGQVGVIASLVDTATSPVPKTTQ